MNILNKILKYIEILITYIIPLASFIVLFVLFIMQVFFRYVLKEPISWSNELITVMYVFLIFLGAAYTGKTHEHMVFPLVYEKASQKVQCILQIVGNTILTITFVLLIVPSIKKMIFYFNTTSTAMLHISYGFIILPISILIIFSIVYFIRDIVTYVIKLNSMKKTKNASDIDQHDESITTFNDLA